MYRTVATNLRTAGSGSRLCQKKSLSPCPCPGTLYEHYKGGRYIVLAKARHTETEEELVIYRDENELGAGSGSGSGPKTQTPDLSGSKVWARPLDMWNEMVEVHGVMVQRFREIPEN